MSETKENFDEYEQAALMFNAMSKQFRKMGYSLAKRKKNSPIRVLEALVFEPLEEVKLEGKHEQELLDICRRMIYYKMKIHEYAIKEEEKKELDNGK